MYEKLLETLSEVDKIKFEKCEEQSQNLKEFLSTIENSMYRNFMGLVFVSIFNPQTISIKLIEEEPYNRLEVKMHFEEIRLGFNDSLDRLKRICDYTMTMAPSKYETTNGIVVNITITM